MIRFSRSAQCSLGRLGLGLGVGLLLGGGIIGFLRHRRYQASQRLHLQQQRIASSSAAAASSPAPAACGTSSEAPTLPSADKCQDEGRLLEVGNNEAEYSLVEGTAGALTSEQQVTGTVDCLPSVSAATESAAAQDDCAESQSDSSDSSDTDGEAPSPSGQQSLATYLARHGLERCEPVKELGKGGCGRAQSVSIPIPGGGVMQAVRKEIFRRTDGVSRTELLRQEVAGTLAAAGCASAVQLLGWTEPQTDDDPHELLLSYVPGMPLSDYLMLVHCVDVDRRSGVLKKAKKSKRAKAPKPRTILSTPLLKQLAISMLTAVDVMHNNNMCHGDIKGDNVFVDLSASDGAIRFVLGDMGTAEPTDSEGMLIRGAIGGSWLTAAPEQRVHLAGGTPACGLSRMIDLASVGLLLADAAQFCVEAGRLVAYSLFEDDLDEWVPEGCRDLCAQLLAPSPSDRPSAKEALAHWWLNE